MACHAARARGAVAAVRRTAQLCGTACQREVARTFSTASEARLDRGSITSPTSLTIASDTLEAWATEASKQVRAYSLCRRSNSVGDLAVERPRKALLAVSKDFRAYSAVSWASA